MSVAVQLPKDVEGSAATEGPLLPAALGALPEGVAVVERGRIVYANEAFAELFGIAGSREIEGRRLAEFVPLMHREDSDAADNALPAEEFTHTRADGTCLDLRTSSSSFHVEDRHLLVVGARNVSEFHQAVHLLRESQGLEMLGRMVGTVAHDFNNLITGILLYSDLLLARLPRKGRLRRHVSEVRAASQQGAALVQQLLTVARPEAAGTSCLSWNETIEEMQDLLVRLAGDNVDLVPDLAPGLAAVEMDAAKMRQILLNLVLNARDAMPSGGKVTLATRNCVEHLANSRVPAGCVEFSVADGGCGMDAETRCRLFKPFFTTKPPGKGNGLGLFSVYGIVTQSGGTVHVESEKGRGTRVVVRLPRARQNPPPAPEHKRKR